ncbi:MAG: efflux RND transporter periplasmic adaptor subunit [Gammaproteobacteria bacterium]|jgi:membrane fusion protein (multidrug efflux system)|nr:efflux RND transporter periplasmic adaptor subunit [Gammaproteobacteria bacterium]
MHTRRRFVAPILAPFLTLAAALLLAACSEPQQEQQTPPSPVRVITVEASDATLDSEYAGRIRGSREVEVRARVEGILHERLYNEGQIVEQGEELFLIDPEPYEIAVRQAEAEVANARANLSQAEREWNRISGLYERDAVSERERDQAQSALELAEAGLALAEAGRASAELNLKWTRVTAPIAGVTGLETVPEGSLVSTGALLTTVTQTDPVHVRFALPERDAVMQSRARRAMTGSAEELDLPARLELPDGSEYSLEGRVDFADATIDPRTGSVGARAVFDNPEGELVPGQFVRIRMTTQSFEDVFRIPAKAISQGPDGPRVFVVDDDNTARSRRVELGPTLGSDRLVLSGPEAGDRIVVSGLNNLRDGMTVEPQTLDPTESDDGA